MNVKQLVEYAFSKEREAYKKKEQDALGNLRAGNTGIITTNGMHMGKCIRLAYLRTLGIDPEQKDFSTLVMFAGGIANESVWDKWLAHSFPPEKIRREEAIPIYWETSLGDSVTGRPDAVIVDEKGLPEHGLEYKMASSLWTAKAVNMPPKQPKFEHMGQAGHYQWQLSEQAGRPIPYTLAYTSFVQFAIAGFWQQWFPKYREEGSEGLSYKEDKYGKWQPDKVLPFVQGFELEWAGPEDEDALRWRPEGTEAWTSTKHITRGGIKRFFEKLSEMKAAPEQYVMSDKEVPMAMEGNGNKASYSPCNYCPLASVCRDAERKSLTLQDWSDTILVSVPGSSSILEEAAPTNLKENG